MIWKLIWLFLLTCGLSGLLSVLGSIGGNAFGRTGLFIGAVVGGIIGIALAGWFAQVLRLIDRQSYRRTVISGIVGYIVAAVIAVNNLHTPIIPLLSASLIGLGAVVGSLTSRKMT